MILTLNDFIFGLFGGILIGLASAIIWIGLGRIAGISGIFSSIFTQKEGRGWRIAFMLGLIGGGSALIGVDPALLTDSTAHFVIAAVGGLFVGLGAVLASGCTSGHGVCGLSRFSIRSFVAIGLFILAGFATVTVVNWLQ